LPPAKAEKTAIWINLEFFKHKKEEAEMLLLFDAFENRMIMPVFADGFP